MVHPTSISSPSLDEPRSTSPSTDLPHIVNKHHQTHEQKSTFLQMHSSSYLNHTCVFTDRSHCPDTPATAASMYLPHSELCLIWRIPETTEITHAELFAIFKSCQYLRKLYHEKIVIYTDSKLAIQLLLSAKPKSYRAYI